MRYITIELNVESKKKMLFFIFKPLEQNIDIFLDRFLERLSFYSKNLENIHAFVDFIESRSDPGVFGKQI